MKTRFTTKDERVGARIEIYPHYDLWMRGAQYGTIHSVSTCGKIVRVRMDHVGVKNLARIAAGEYWERN